jgi:hypothetical protein
LRHQIGPKAKRLGHILAIVLFNEHLGLRKSWRH